MAVTLFVDARADALLVVHYSCESREARRLPIIQWVSSVGHELCSGGTEPKHQAAKWTRLHPRRGPLVPLFPKLYSSFSAFRCIILIACGRCVLARTPRLHTASFYNNSKREQDDSSRPAHRALRLAVESWSPTKPKRNTKHSTAHPQ